MEGWCKRLKYCIETFQELDDKKNPVVLSGNVVDLNGNSIGGVIIKVKKLDYNYTPRKITNLGYTISKKDGAYCICLEKKCGVDYKLCLFPPLIRE